MGETNNKKKKVITIVISIVIILILALAISYAFFSTQLSGTDQIVKVGELELVLDETSEGINLGNAIGISDSKGMSSTPSTFELRNNGSKAVDYTIYLDDNTIGDTDTRIDDKYLKYNLNKNGTDSGATLLTKTGTNPNRVIDSGTIKGGATNKYNLKLWITDEVDGNYSGQVFSGKLRVEVSQARPSAGDTILAGLGDSGDTYDDGTDTFITGEDPNNYIWYSGKLWRAVSVNKEANTTKLVTQWNISAIPYNASDNTAFEGSYMEDWLNDTSIDGFLYNLRDYENFIVTDAVWDATMDSANLGSIERPNGTTTVTASVGLLNMYEYQSSNNGNANGYLNNGLDWWTLTPYSSSRVRFVYSSGYADYNSPSNITYNIGVRPAIKLKSNVKIVDGDGTVDNPYRLNGDNDTDLSGTLLSSRYSGEYIRFGNDENNLYRIVSHENGVGTKIVSTEPLKSSSAFITSAFGSSTTFSSTNTIGTFLNGEYLTSYVDSNYGEMIEDSTSWYLGTVGDGGSYKLAKYTDTNMSSTTSSITDAKVGLLRLGELMAGQFDRYDNNADYWTLTAHSSSSVWFLYDVGVVAVRGSVSYYSKGVRPSLNLKSNVIITSGNGTKENPFEIALQ